MSIEFGIEIGCSGMVRRFRGSPLRCWLVVQAVSIWQPGSHWSYYEPTEDDETPVAELPRLTLVVLATLVLLLRLGPPSPALAIR